MLKMGFAENYLIDMGNLLNKLELDHKKIEKIGDLFYNAWEYGKQVFILGNGGSASTASHFACDLGKGTLKNVYDKDEKRMRVQSLTDNVAIMTAYANDTDYGHIFSQQLNNLVNKKDLVAVITGGGNSKNVINAVQLANEKGAITIGLLGFDGGKVKDILNHYIIVPSNHYGRIEDAHLILCHLIACYIFDKKNKK